MADDRFPILGNEIPPMLGRSVIMARIWNELTKTTPSHLSVVGPRFSGKSVLLKNLEQKMRGADSPYCAVIRWDLGHRTPRSDDEFMRQLCHHLGEGLKQAGNEYGDHLLNTTEGHYGEVHEVMDVLYSEDSKILMLWDGFDKPLNGGMLTRNLWDNLLDLCRKPSFRLVTCTRKDLHLLIRDENSVTSDFWGVFGDIIRIGVFDELDMKDIFSQLPALQFQTGAKTELLNWSAGYPPFVFILLNHIIAKHDNSKVENSLINQVAVMPDEILSAMLSSLWNDCPATARDLYWTLVERGEIPASETGKAERSALTEKGFAVESGNKLRVACRFLQEHIKGSGSEPGTMARLFGAWEDYRSNIRNLLERRLSHISRFDDRLYRLVERAIDDIPDYPDDCLNNLVGIRDCALNLIWKCEFGPKVCIPSEIISYWTESPRRGHQMIDEKMKTNCWDIPTDPLGQIRLLSLLTGSFPNFGIRAKMVSKDTYVLINSIHNFRNRTQHHEGQTIHLGVAVAAIMTCIELLACLEREMV